MPIYFHPLVNSLECDPIGKHVIILIECQNRNPSNNTMRNTNQYILTSQQNQERKKKLIFEFFSHIFFSLVRALRSNMLDHLCLCLWLCLSASIHIDIRIIDKLYGDTLVKRATGQWYLIITDFFVACIENLEHSQITQEIYRWWR